jgi:hypothetical protein
VYTRSVDLDQAAEIATQLAEALEDAASIIEQQSRRAKGAVAALNGLFEMFPELKQGLDQTTADEPDDGTPRGQEAVKRVLADSPGRGWTVSGLVEELYHRGWQPNSRDPANAVRVALERVVASDPAQFRKESGDIGGTLYSYWPFDIADSTYARLQAGLVPVNPDIAEGFRQALAAQFKNEGEELS